MVADRLVLVLPLLAWIATYLVHSTGLFCGVWVFLRLCPKCGPAWREGLWKGALLGGVLTATLQSVCDVPQPFGAVALSLNTAWLTHVTETKTERLDASSRRPAASLSPSSNGTADELWIVEEIAAGDAVAADMTVRRDSPDMAASPPTTAPALGRAGSAIITRIRDVLFAAPLAIAGLATLWGFGRCLKQSLVFRQRLAGCNEVVAGRARQFLDDLCVELPRPRRVRLLSSLDDPEPAAFGLRQWTIVLPQRAEQDLADDELRALLAHEVAHLVRGDVAWLGVWRVVCSCLAFQPLNHVARREWQRAAEWLCDNWAVSRTGSRLALARCLTEVAGWRLGPAACAPSLAATGNNRGLASRIERLIDETPLTDADNRSNTSRRFAAVGGLILAALACCAPRISLSMPGAEQRTSDQQAAIIETETAAAPTGDGEVLFLVQSNSDFDPTINPEAPAVGEFAQLDREWSALAAELASLEPLLQRQGLTAEERSIAERLAHQIAALKSRHAELGRIRKQRANGSVHSPVKP